MLASADRHAQAGPAAGEAAHAAAERHKHAEDRADVSPASADAQRRHLRAGGEGRAFGPAVRVPGHPGTRPLSPTEAHRSHQNEHKLSPLLALLRKNKTRDTFNFLMMDW